MNDDGEDSDEAEVNEGVKKDWVSARLHFPKVYKVIVAGKLKQQPRRQNHEQHRRYNCRYPLRHFLILLVCYPGREILIKREIYLLIMKREIYLLIMKIINLNPSRLVEWHIATWCYMSAVSWSKCWMVTIISNIVNHCIIALGLVDLKKLKLHQVDKRRSNYKCMIYIYMCANLHAYSCVCVHLYFVSWWV